MTYIAPGDGSGTHWREAQLSLTRLGQVTSTLWASWAGGTITLIAGFILVCLAALFVSLNVNQLRDSFAWERHTGDVLYQIEREREALLQAESSARAYVLGGGPESFANFERAYADAASRIGTLQNLVSDNPAQVRRLVRLRPLVQERLNRLGKTRTTKPLELRTPTETLALAGHVQESVALMTRIRAQTEELRNAELQLLQTRQQEADRRAVRSITFAVVTALIALGCCIAGVSLLLRERSEHRVREMRTELMHSQRLTLMGQTASMLAHELNQPLAAATNYLAALRRLAAGSGSDAAARMEEVAQKAVAQMQRAGGIVKRLRGFIDKRDTERSRESPATLVNDAVMLLGTLDDSMTLQTLVEPTVPDILVDRIQLQQVLVNLLRNAIEAMRDSARRVLTLRVLSISPHMVEISLQDTGPGLAKEVAQRLFQPFVTSKKEGMGVGLSICHSIVTDHGGTIWAEPAPGGGTLFRFTLPTADETEAA